MEDDRAGEPVARQDEEPEEVAGIVVAVVGNVEEAFAGCKREAFAADSNIAAVSILAGLAGHNTGIEGAKGGRTGQKVAGAGSGAGLVAAGLAAGLVVGLAAALLAAGLAAGLAVGPGVEILGPGRIRRLPR